MSVCPMDFKTYSIRYTHVFRTECTPCLINTVVIGRVGVYIYGRGSKV